MPRMNVLNSVERESFDSPPVFNSLQRKQYFDFPTKLRRVAESLRNSTHRLGFLLSAGYFKATKRFFSPRAFHPRDVEYVARLLEPVPPTAGFADYRPRTPSSVISPRSGPSTASGSSTMRGPASCSKRSPAWCIPKSNPKSCSGAVSTSWCVKGLKCPATRG